MVVNLHTVTRIHAIPLLHLFDGRLQIFQSGSRRHEGLWESVSTEDATYEICLSNEFSMTTPKQIFFIIVVDTYVTCM